MLGPLEGDTSHPRELLVEMLTFRFERRLSQLEALNEMPLFPTEQVRQLHTQKLLPAHTMLRSCGMRISCRLSSMQMAALLYPS